MQSNRLRNTGLIGAVAAVGPSAPSEVPANASADTPESRILAAGEPVVSALLGDGVVEMLVPTGGQNLRFHFRPGLATKLSIDLHQSAAAVRRGSHVKKGGR